MALPSDTAAETLAGTFRRRLPRGPAGTAAETPARTPAGAPAKAPSAVPVDAVRDALAARLREAVEVLLAGSAAHPVAPSADPAPHPFAYRLGWAAGELLNDGLDLPFRRKHRRTPGRSHPVAPLAMEGAAEGACIEIDPRGFLGTPAAEVAFGAAAEGWNGRVDKYNEVKRLIAKLADNEGALAEALSETPVSWFFLGLVTEHAAVDIEETVGGCSRWTEAEGAFWESAEGAGLWERWQGRLLWDRASGGAAHKTA
ncbi:hypothetical protein [Caniella muris]|uniref:hypothetical protein n=1 Tax=Caniella muris TaxID=2941502 RepID=UPI00203F25FF|nr:hypothetical protein [Caniella muris]